MSWQAQHFVNLHVQISWQAQHFVKLEVQISWQAFPEIADARNAVFFNRKGGSEAGQSSFAERCVRDGLGSWSDHGRIMVGIVPQHFVNLHVQISWQAQHFVNFHVTVQISWQVQHFVNLHVQISWQAQHFARRSRVMVGSWSESSLHCD